MCTLSHTLNTPINVYNIALKQNFMHIYTSTLNKLKPNEVVSFQMSIYETPHTYANSDMAV